MIDKINIPLPKKKKKTRLIFDEFCLLSMSSIFPVKNMPAIYNELIIMTSSIFYGENTKTKNRLVN